MKKFVSIALVLVMVLSMATVAFAETATYNLTTKENDTKTISLKKAYTVSGETQEVATSLFPKETLTLTATPKSVPDGVELDSVGNITLSTIETSAQAATAYNVTATLPAYTTVGTYVYEVSETGSTQGVTYATNKVELTVLVVYDYADTNGDKCNLMVQTIGVADTGNGKADTFTNTYNVGSLKVSKTVEGVLASTTKAFTINVNFESEKAVGSAVTYGDQTLTWTLNETTKKYVASAVIELSHDTDVTFNNIPDGITYTVEEADKHLEGDLNGEEGYTVSYTAEKVEGAGTNGKGAVASGTVNGSTEDTVAIKNTKTTTVATGITMDTIPYIVVLAVAVMGLVAVVANKRRAAEF